MVALQQSVGGLPTSHSGSSARTFADVLLSKPMSSTPSDPVVHANPTDPITHATPSPIQPILGLHKGLPSIEFTDPLVHDLSKPYGWSLIGKFAQGYNKSDPKLGRPSVENIQKYLVAMDFKGEFTVGLMDNRHAWIYFSCEEDYLRLYSRQVWYIGGIAMRIFKWTPYFQVDIESSLVPVWIKFWGHDLDSPRRVWRSWQEMAKPVLENGLGFKDFHTTFLAYSCKLWWKWRTNHGLWSTYVNQVTWDGRWSGVACFLWMNS